MCFAESSVSVEIEEGDLVTEQYKCSDCSSQVPRDREKGKMPDV